MLFRNTINFVQKPIFSQETFSRQSLGSGTSTTYSCSFKVACKKRMTLNRYKMWKKKNPSMCLQFFLNSYAWNFHRFINKLSHTTIVMSASTSKFIKAKRFKNGYQFFIFRNSRKSSAGSRGNQTIANQTRNCRMRSFLVKLFVLPLKVSQF